MLARLLLLTFAAPVALAAQSRMISSGKTGMTLAPAAGPPVGVVRVTPGPSSVSLRWNCVTGSTGYEVYGMLAGQALAKLTPAPINPNCVQDLPATNLPLRNAPPGTTFQTTYSTGFYHGGLTPGQQFSYVVRVLYPTGSADSDPVFGKPDPWPAPTGLSAGANPTGPFLQWNRVPNMWGNYVVSRKRPGETAFTPIATRASHEYYYGDNGLTPGIYEYIVQAVDGLPTAPLSFRAGTPWVNSHVSRGEPRFSLYWQQHYAGATIRILSSPAAAGAYADVTFKGRFDQDNWRSDEGSVGATNYYKVAAVYSGGLVMESPPHPVTIPPPPPGPINPQASYRPAIVTLTWTCDPYAEFYTLHREWPNGSRPYLLDPQKKLVSVKGCGYVDGDPIHAMDNTYVIVAHYEDRDMRNREVKVVITVP